MGNVKRIPEGNLCRVLCQRWLTVTESFAKCTCVINGVYRAGNLRQTFVGVYLNPTVNCAVKKKTPASFLCSFFAHFIFNML